MGKGITIDIIP